MAPQIIHLPDGQNFTVTPVFAGLFFKSHELNTHPGGFPIGWTIVLHTEDDDDEGDNPPSGDQNDDDEDEDDEAAEARRLRERRRDAHIHSFTRPTLQNDNLFISSISSPSSNDFKPPASPTRQIAMMLWITLFWYFQQPAPSATLQTEASKSTPAAGKPRGEWRINIKRDGVLRGRNLIPKLERMGLIASLDSAVGTAMDDASESWAHMFVSRRMFWQIPGQLFLFMLQPIPKGASSYPGSPAPSRPGSPVRNETTATTTAVAPAARLSGRLSPADAHGGSASTPHSPGPTPLVSLTSFPIGPYFSASHLPTYFPPPVAHYTLTNYVRHPVRPKPPRMGEVFYSRFVPSAGQYLSFRVASMSPKPVPYLGPVGDANGNGRHGHHHPHLPPEHAYLATLSDTNLLREWLGKPRVAAFWGDYDPEFLSRALRSRHSFPVIGLWDGVPFGYFEIYWAREDLLGRHVGTAIDDWDRGFHVLVGEEWARGRVESWLTSMVHWILCSDYRTMSVCVEPRVDNARWVVPPLAISPVARIVWSFCTGADFPSQIHTIPPSCGFLQGEGGCIPAQAGLVRAAAA